MWISLRTQSAEKVGSGQPEHKMTISKDDRDELYKEFVEEQNEGGIIDGVWHFKHAHLPSSIEIRGIYESLIEVGFNENQAIAITIAEVQISRR